MSWRRWMAAFVVLVAAVFTAWLAHTQTWALIPLVWIGTVTAALLLLFVERDEREQRVLDALWRAPWVYVGKAEMHGAGPGELATVLDMEPEEVERHLQRRATHDPRIFKIETATYPVWVLDPRPWSRHPGMEDNVPWR